MLHRCVLYFPSRNCISALLVWKRCMSANSNSIMSIVHSIVDASQKKHVKDSTLKNRRINSICNDPGPIKFKLPGQNVPILPNCDGHENKDLEVLGRLHVAHYISRYILNSRPQTLHEDVLEASNKLIKLLDSNTVNGDQPSSLSRLGLLSIHEDYRSDDLLAKCIDKFQPDVNIFLDYFNRIMGENIGYGVVNSFYPPSVSLPSLQGSYVNTICRYAYFSEVYEKDQAQKTPSATVEGKLAQLEEFGKLSFDFHLLKSLMKSHRMFGSKTPELVENINSNIENLARFTWVDRSTVSVINNTSNELSKSLFYRYLALCDFKGASLADYFDHLLQYFEETQGIPEEPKSQEPLLSLVDQPVSFQLDVPDELKEKMNSNNQFCQVVENNGKSYLASVIHRGFLENKLPIREKRHKIDYLAAKLIKKIEKGLLQNKIFLKGLKPHLSGYMYLGLLACLDGTRCLALIRSHFKSIELDPEFHSYRNLLTFLICNRGLPFIGFRSQTFTKGTLSFPIIEDKSLISRFMMINGTVISPRDKSRDKNKKNQWLYDNQISDALLSLQDYGRYVYSHCIFTFLINSLSSESVTLLPRLIRLTTSNKFFNFVLAKSEDFELLINQKYEKRLLRKRFSKSLISGQFFQHIARLKIDGKLESWLEGVTSTFVELINNLDYSDSVEVIEEFDKAFGEQEFPLSKRFIATRIKEVSNAGSYDFLLSQTEDSQFAMETGESYVNYLIDLFNINLGLDSFVHSKKEMLNLLGWTFRNNGIDYSKLGTWLIQNKVTGKSELMVNLLETIFDRKLPNFDEANVPSINSTLRQKENDIMGLPIPENGGSIYKLLQINYFISRSFLSKNKSKIANMNASLDVCTKFNSIGKDYYKYLSFLKLSTLDMSRDTAQRFGDLLLDKKFKSHVFYKSQLDAPFDDNRYYQLYRNYASNSYYELKFIQQGFNQYVGFLAYYNPVMLERWFDAILHQILMLSQSERKDLELIKKIEKKIHKAFQQVKR